MWLKVSRLSMASVILIAGISLAAHALSQEITFECVTVADGEHFWVQKWESSDGVAITEYMHGYSSQKEARTAFEKELKDAETIIERKKNPEGFSKVDERAVGNFVNPESKEKTVSIIRLQQREVYRADAPSLRYALAFEEYRKRDNE